MGWMQDKVEEEGFLGGCGYIIFVFGLFAVAFVVIGVLGFMYWKELLIWAIAFVVIIGGGAGVIIFKDWNASVKTKSLIIVGIVVLIGVIVLTCMGISSCSENSKLDNYEQAYIEKCRELGITVTEVTFSEGSWGYVATLHCEGDVEVTEELKDSIYWIGTVHQQPYYGEDYLIFEVVIKSDSGVCNLK